MNTDTILRHLVNTGINVLGTDGNFIYLEDPSCVLRSFETFINYAWIAITAITALLLFGWAVSMIRGAKNGPNNLILNLRNLTIIFGVLTAVKPAMNLIWGNDLFARGCKVIKVSIPEIQNILALQNSGLSSSESYDENTNSESLSISQKLSNISAGNFSSGNYVIYTDENGNKYKKIGGTIAWRNNNPGNLRFNDFVRYTLGAIGSANGFAVFSNEQTGSIAIKKLLQTSAYQKLTVGGVINRYAPPIENDTTGYQNHVKNLTGLNLETPMSQLNDSELDRIVNAIKKVEGWQPGKIESLN